jgi:DNA-binding CsgD family transcriptional regulator
LAAIVVDSTGQIRYHNRLAAFIFAGDESRQMTGSGLRDSFDHRVVDEWLVWQSRVVQTGVSLDVEQIWQGRRIRMTFCLLANQSAPLLLMAARYASQHLPGNQRELPVEQSRFMDLGPLDVLTNREFQTLLVLGEGKSVPEAARILAISPKTLEKHKTQIGHKLGTDSGDRIVQHVTRIGLRRDDSERIAIQFRLPSLK